MACKMAHPLPRSGEKTDILGPEIINFFMLNSAKH